MLSKNILWSQRIRYHLIFWVTLFSSKWLVYGISTCEYRGYLASIGATMGFIILATYYTVYFLIPRYLLKKKYLLFAGWFLGSALLFALANRVVLHFMVYPIYFPNEVKYYDLLSWTKILLQASNIYATVGIIAAAKLVKHWYQHEHLQQKLEKEKLKTELKFLRSQIHPHFLFNTLNNLYGLTLTQSPKAPEIVEKLSDLLKYMLYDSNQPKVSLQDELSYLRNYIALEKIRFDDRLEISLNLPQETYGIHIAPMILLPFIENSFKHGVNSQMDMIWIRVDLSIIEGTLVLKVENSLIHEDSPITQGGIGLSNVKRRLELLYHNQYQLEIFTEEDTYLVVLKLILERAAPQNTEQSLNLENALSV